MNDDLPPGLLAGLLIVLLLLSAFFSITETALARVGRWRSGHETRSGKPSASRADELLKQPDRVAGTLVLARHAANLGAAAVATLISVRLGGHAGVLAGVLVLLLVVLVGAEAVPRTIGALHAPRLAPPAAALCGPLLNAARPLLWLATALARAALRPFGMQPESVWAGADMAGDGLAGAAEPDAAGLPPTPLDRDGVAGIETITVDDVMVPRQEIVGIDLERDWQHNLDVIRDSPHERLPVYRDEIDNIIGVVRTRALLPALARDALTEPRLLEETREADFVPEGTPLNRQLLNFRQQKRRSAFVVDEYGDVQGLITAEDILREVVGELDNEPVLANTGVAREDEGSFVVDASTNVRRLNRLMSWHLPTDGPKTLNGLIVERLETIPEPGTKLVVNDYPIEILDVSEHGIRQVRVMTPSEDDALPPLRAVEG